jgi:hypothetical protein
MNRNQVRTHSALRNGLTQSLPKASGEVKKGDLLRSATEQHSEDGHLNTYQDPVRTQERHRYRPRQFAPHRHAHHVAVFRTSLKRRHFRHADHIAATVTQHPDRLETEKTLGAGVPQTDALRGVNGERGDICVAQQFPHRNLNVHLALVFVRFVRESSP